MNSSGIIEMEGGTSSATVSFYVGTAGISFMFFTLLFFFISPRFSSRYLKPYNGFTTAKKIDWDTRTGSNIHAVVVCVIAIYVLCFDQETNDNPIWSEAVLVRSGISVTFGYIVADFMIICLKYSSVGDLFILVHHLMAIIAYYCVVVHGVLPYFANFRQLAELSTIFVNQRWYYSASGKSHSSQGFLINAWCMAGSFFLCRIAVMPFYYYKCYSVWGTPEVKRIGLAFCFFWLATCVVLDAINLFWITKMIRGGIKLLRNAKKEQND